LSEASALGVIDRALKRRVGSRLIAVVCAAHRTRPKHRTEKRRGQWPGSVVVKILLIATFDKYLAKNFNHRQNQTAQWSTMLTWWEVTLRTNPISGRPE